MLIGRIRSKTDGDVRVHGKSQGYMGLPVRHSTMNSTVTGPETPCMETAWLPTLEDIGKMLDGQPVIVRILGKVPPPMFVKVGDDD